MASQKKDAGSSTFNYLSIDAYLKEREKIRGVD
jgi:hypothetical protein